MGDIRKELKERLDAIEQKAQSLYREKARIDEELKEITEQWNALRLVYKRETEDLGEVGDSVNRFAGMRLVDAVALIRKERWGVTKKQVKEVLAKEGFDFRGKNPGKAVHFAWVAVDNRKKKGGE
jgi:regulator of replication initiation timing